MTRRVDGIWREAMPNNAPNTAVPQNADFITPANRDVGTDRGFAAFPATNFLRTNGNDNPLVEEVESAVRLAPDYFGIHLSPIVAIAHRTLPRQ